MTNRGGVKNDTNISNTETAASIFATIFDFEHLFSVSFVIVPNYMQVSITALDL